MIVYVVSRETICHDPVTEVLGVVASIEGAKKIAIEREFGLNALDHVSSNALDWHDGGKYIAATDARERVEYVITPYEVLP